MNALSPQTLVLGGGCFWCTEAVFVRVKGVLDVESGYANGNAQRYPRPSYEQVCSGETGYNEVVKLVHDPAVVSTRDLLEVFFATHDPTTLNRQGADTGPQYRSGIYYADESQHAVARRVLAEAQQAHGGRVVTELEAVRGYQRAEDYHQRYFERHPQAGYCAFVIAPKVEKFRQAFAKYLRDGA